MKKIEIWERWKEKGNKVYQLLSYDRGHTWEEKYIPYLKHKPYTTWESPVIAEITTPKVKEVTK